MLAIENTPFDWAIKLSKSGKAIYTWEVMQAYLPWDIEPFYSEPEEYDSRDDWHCTPGTWLGGMDEFTFWRRNYMKWFTEGEKRQEEKKRQEQLQAAGGLLAYLDEVKKRYKTYTSKKSRKTRKKCKTSKKSRPRRRAQEVSDFTIGERTPSSAHSWMHADEATPSSPDSLFGRAEEAGNVAIGERTPSSAHSWMPEATPSSPHSWMHEETEKCIPMLKMATGDQVLLGRDQ